MDYTALATAALEKRAALVTELRTVAESSASDADKATHAARIEAGITQYEDEARAYVATGEHEAEVRDIGARASALLTLSPKEKREVVGALVSLRAVSTGETAEYLMDMGAGLNELRIGTTGTPGNAGFAHPTVSFIGQVVQYMRERSSILGMARILNTASGEPLEIPRRILTPTAVGPIAENASITKSDIGLDRLTFGAYKYGVIAEATAELLEDEQIGYVSMLAQDIAEAVADRVSTFLMVGTGTAQPTGLITAAVAGAAGGANLAAVGFDELISLQHSVAVPYRKNGTLFTSDTLVASLRKKKDSAGQYLWQPSVVAGRLDTVLGMPVTTDPNFPIAGAGAKVAVYGDISKYTVRQVRNLTVVRSDEFGWDRDVVAFKVTWRGDGNILDANGIKALTVTA